MHYRNRRKIILSATAIAAAALSGCATPQHTNLLIFGTNTVVGLKVGADATSTPAIQVGYARQELVLMPLLANTGGTGDKLSPCPATTTPPATVPVNCKFTGNAGTDLDSYSVLASFGAKFDATKEGGDAKAGGAIAQYFATGLAARELATHGSSLVAATDSATAESGSSTSYVAISTNIRAERETFATQVEGLGTDFLTKLDAVDKALVLGSTGFARGCKSTGSAAACAAIIRDPENFDSFLPATWKQANAQLKGGS